MRPAALAVALGLLVSWAHASSAAPAVTAVAIGGQSILLPPPPGWAAVDTTRDEARAPFTRFISSNERVLAGFAPRTEGRDVPAGESLMKLALAASTTALESEDVSPDRFAAILAVFRAEMPEAEVLVEDSDALAILILMQAQTETGEPLPDYLSASMMLFTRVKARFVRLGMFDFTASAAGVATYRSTAAAWLAAIRVANGEPDQPAM